MGNKVSLIGTLPPIKGSSLYCWELLASVSKHASVDFIGFRAIYPNFLYPGGTKVMDHGYGVPQVENAKVRNILAYYNPFSWVRAGVTADGEVVHAQWWSHILAPLYLVVLSICKMRRKKILITVHNALPHGTGRLSRFLNRVVLYLGDAFIAHDEQNKESLAAVYNIPRDKIFVVPHGVPRFVPCETTEGAARERLGIPQDKKVLLCFGNIRDYKGLDVLLKSLRLVKEQVSQVLLVIAGEPWGKWDAYGRIIEENTLQDFVLNRLSFVAPSELESYFSASDAVVLPYKYFDAQSGIGALALAFNKPLIVTNVGGLPSFVKDKRAIAKPNDEQDLARVIVGVLQDESLLSKLSSDSEEIARDCSWDKVAEQTVRLYENLLS